MSESVSFWQQPVQGHAPHGSRDTTDTGAARVMAVIVSHNGSRWLPGLLDSLRDSQRVPEDVIAVDTGSTDDSVALLNAGVSDLAGVGDVLELRADATFGQAVSAAVAARSDVIDLRAETIDLTERSNVARHVAEEPETGEQATAPSDPAQSGSAPSEPEPGETLAARAEGTVEWLWLLHDDCEVSPGALSALLDLAAQYPDADVIGPKIHDLGNRRVLKECGTTWSVTGQKLSGIEANEVDQGQLNHRLDVVGVSSAGMLVKAEVWERLKGFSKALPMFGDDQEFCYRVRRSGGRVLVATDAIVYHLDASRGPRKHVSVRGVHSVARARERAAATTSLMIAPLWRLPFTAIRLLLMTTVGALLTLLSMLPGKASDRFFANLMPLLRPLRILGARRRSARTATTRRRVLTEVRTEQALTTDGWHETFSSRLGAGPLYAIARMRRRSRTITNMLLAVALPLLLLSLAVSRDLWLTDGMLQGGALQPALPGGIDTLWSFAAPWHEVGLGSDVPSPPYLLALAVASILTFGSTPALVQILLLLLPVFAGLTAFVSLRGVVAGLPRIAASVAFGLLPASVSAVGAGRLSLAVAAVFLPLVCRGLVRLVVAPDKLPAASRNTVIGVCLGLALIVAFSPPVGLLLFVCAVLGALVARRGAVFGKLWLAAALVIGLLWPWSWYLLQNPGLALLDTGAAPTGLNTPVDQPWQLLLLDPGGVAAPPLGLGAVVLVAALAATWAVGDKRVAATAWGLSAIAVALGSVLVLFPVPVPWSSVGQQAWPGSATLVMGAALLTLIAIGSAVSRRQQARSATRRGLTVILPGLLMAGSLAIGGWWLLEGDAQLEKADPAVVSAFIAEEATGPAAPRTLVMSTTDSGNTRTSYNYLLVSGAGPILGDADVAPNADGLAWFDESVSRLASGDGGQDLDQIGAAGVRYIQANAKRDRQLSRRLDSVSGLKRLSTVQQTGLWEVEAWQPRARLVTAQGEHHSLPIMWTPGGSVAVDTSVSTDDGAVVQIAESPSPLWSAKVTTNDGEEVNLVTVPEGQFATFEGVGGERLSIEAQPEQRWLSLLVPAATLVLLIFWATVRRRKPA